MGYKAIIAGASGLIGSNLLTTLLNHAEYDEVVVLVRKELPFKHKKLVQLIVNFDELHQHADAITGHAIFSCMGTTRAKTPNLDTYRKIDHDYPVEIAKLAKANGVKQFHLISAVGANAASGNFYLKLKGDVEASLQGVGFEILHIYQPSMLYGGRTEQRAMEKVWIGLFKLIDPLLIGGWRKYRSISGDTVARAMYKNSLKPQPGLFIHTFDNITNA